VLNVGFGMGLVDQAIQRYEPEEHTIVEAHPEVYARMLKLGWGEKKNVRILFGRWQDVLPQLGSYDGITKSLIIFSFLKYSALILSFEALCCLLVLGIDAGLRNVDVYHVLCVCS
jgi:hypothetical protein